MIRSKRRSHAIRSCIYFRITIDVSTSLILFAIRFLTKPIKLLVKNRDGIFVLPVFRFSEPQWRVSEITSLKEEKTR